MNKFLRQSLLSAAACAALVPATAPSASAAVIAGTCTAVGAVDVCVSEVSETSVGTPLYTVSPGQYVSVGQVAAYLDRYRFGSLVLPCVTPVVNGTELDACGMVGLERVGREVLVAPSDVGTNTQQLQEYGSVYVCEATLKALVAGFGESGRSIFTVCGTESPTH